MDESAQKFYYRKTFDQSACEYDNGPLRFFGYSAEGLVSLLDLKGTEHVLDVATGTGHSALRLAHRLPYGKVTAIDFSPAMLAMAASKASAESLANIEFREMDMQHLDFPKKSFDHAVCSYGIFFVDDMHGVIEGMASVVKSGGSLIISTFSETTFAPLSDLFYERLRKFGIDPPPGGRASAKIATFEKCLELFRSAGLPNAEVSSKQVGYYLATPDDWWSVVMGGAFRGLVNCLAPGQVEEFKREHLTEVAELATVKGIWLEVTALYTKGTVA
jgi:ubiquinone/menaquinone biosynthesis C-methylase UbiE